MCFTIVYWNNHNVSASQNKKDGENMLYMAIDYCLSPHQVDKLLDEAILLCPVMHEENLRMYPANLKRLFPYETEEFWRLGAMLLNDLAFEQ